MSKKQARQKKMRDVEARSGLQASQSKQPKALILTPQIAVGLNTTDEQQPELFIEAPNSSGSRNKVYLTPKNVYRVIRDILREKAAEIELERVQRTEAKLRRGKQPNWTTIAQHPQAEIREGLIQAHLCAKGSITVLPTRAAQLKATKAEQTLEEMEL